MLLPPINETIFLEKENNGEGKSVQLTDYPNIYVMLSASDSPTGKFTILGSFSEAEPERGQDGSATNEVSTIEVVDLSDSVSGVKKGSVGVDYSGTAGHGKYIVNITGLRRLNVRIDNYTAGKFTAKMHANSL